jgi:hypothetical protein
VADVPGEWQHTLYPSSNWDDTPDEFPGYGEWGYLPRLYANCSPPPWPPAAVATLDLVSAGSSRYPLARRGLAVLDLTAAGSSRSHVSRAGLAVLDLTAAGSSRSHVSRAGLAVLDLTAAGSSRERVTRSGLATLKLVSAGASKPDPAWDHGFDFRLAGSAITDPNACQIVIPTNLYPVTSGGVTFGWAAANQQGVTRSTTADPRICGMNRNLASNTATFRVDLPATGNYVIRLAWGDIGSGPSNVTLAILDNTTPVLSYGPQTLTLAHFRDANNTDWSQAAWPGSNTSITLTFASTILKLQVAGMPVANQSPVAHLRVTKAVT